MNNTDFISNFLEVSKDEGFSFLCPNKELADPKQLSVGQQALFAATVATAFGVVFGGGAVGGAIVGSNVGYQSHTKTELVEDLQSISQYCEFVGVNLSSGPCIIRPLIDGDEISHETLIGRFAMIHERVQKFRKYTMTIVKNWIFGDTTTGTFAQVFLPFSSHKKARDFKQDCADKCRHREFRKMIHTYPCIVDLEDEEITILNFGLFKSSAAKLKESVFRKRVA